MKKPIVAIAFVLAAAIAAAIYLTHDSLEPSAPAATPTSPVPRTDGESVTAPASESRGTATSTAQSSAPSPVPTDPRLAALAVSPPNDLIEFVKDTNGQVIKEIDKDPASAGFNKPSREYMYSHGKVTGLTTYRYLGDQVEIAQTAVSYKPDGSVDELVEKTSYRDEKPKR